MICWFSKLISRYCPSIIEIHILENCLIISILDLFVSLLMVSMFVMVSEIFFITFPNIIDLYSPNFFHKVGAPLLISSLS